MAKHFPFNVSPAAKRVDDLARQRVFQNSVDGKIPPPARFLDRHVRVTLDHEPAMPAADLPLAPRDRNIKIMPDLINRERFPDGFQPSVVTLARTAARSGRMLTVIRLCKIEENILQPSRLDTENLQIPILRLNAHQLIPDTAADKHGAAAVRFYDFCERQYFLGQRAHFKQKFILP